MKPPKYITELEPDGTKVTFVPNPLFDEPFCKQVKMKNKKFKITISTFPGICLGVSFPLQDYVDMTICILCFGIHIKWRKK